MFEGINLKVQLKKDKFDELNNELFRKTLTIVALALNFAKLLAVFLNYVNYCKHFLMERSSSIQSTLMKWAG